MGFPPGTKLSPLETHFDFLPLTLNCGFCKSKHFFKVLAAQIEMLKLNVTKVTLRAFLTSNLRQMTEVNSTNRNNVDF